MENWLSWSVQTPSELVVTTGSVGQDLLDEGPLVLDELARGGGHEALVVEGQRRVDAGRGAARGGDELPVGEVLAPEGGAPEAVEALDRAVTHFEPLAEGLLAVVAVAATAAVAADLVVDLPGGDVLVGAEDAGDLAHDPAHVAAVGAVVQAGVASAAGVPAEALPVHGGHVRVAAEEPGRGRGGRGAEDDLQPRVGQGLDGAFQPDHVVDAAAWLQARPGELAHPDDVDARIDHHAGVGRPAVLGPVLGVVGNADLHLRLFSSGRPAAAGRERAGALYWRPPQVNQAKRAGNGRVRGAANPCAVGTRGIILLG